MPREPGSAFMTHAQLCADRGWPAPMVDGLVCGGTMLVEADESGTLVAACDVCAFRAGFVRARAYSRPPARSDAFLDAS